MAYSFTEIWAAVPIRQRSNPVKVAIAVLTLGATSIRAAIPAADVKALLKLKLRGTAPTNVSDALRKAAPYVEPHSANKYGLLWWVTDSGVLWIEELSHLKLQGPTSTDLSYGLSCLHPAIRTVAEPLLRDGHCAEAVGRATKELNMLVRKRTGRASDDGIRMMMQVFSPDSNGGTRLVLGPMNQAWERDRQEGFRFLMAGVQQGIANVDKHGSLSVPDQNAALEILALISFLTKYVDSARQLS